MAIGIGPVPTGWRALQPYGDHFSGRGSPPNGNGLITLQDHVIAEYGWEFDTGQRRKKEWNHSHIVPFFPERWGGVQA